jgi:hypothetical protein
MSGIQIRTITHKGEVLILIPPEANNMLVFTPEQARSFADNLMKMAADAEKRETPTPGVTRQ